MGEGGGDKEEYLSPTTTYSDHLSSEKMLREEYVQCFLNVPKLPGSSEGVSLPSDSTRKMWLTVPFCNHRLRDLFLPGFSALLLDPRGPD